MNVKPVLMLMLLGLAAPAPGEEMKVRNVIPSAPNEWSNIPVQRLALKDGGVAYLGQSPYSPPGQDRPLGVFVAFFTRQDFKKGAIYQPADAELYPPGSASGRRDVLIVRGKLNGKAIVFDDQDDFAAITFGGPGAGTGAAQLIGKYAPGSLLVVTAGSRLGDWTAGEQGAQVVSWIEGKPVLARGMMLSSTGARIEVPGPGETGPQETTPRLVRGATLQYVDTASGLSFQYPAAWKQMGPNEARQVMGAVTSQYLTVLIYDPEDRTQNVNVQVLPTAAKDLSEASYADFAREMDRRMPSDYPGFRKVSSRIGRFLDMASLEYVFEATRPDGVRLRQRQLRTGKPGREVAATFTARADLYDRTDATAFKIIMDTLTLK